MLRPTVAGTTPAMQRPRIVVDGHRHIVVTTDTLEGIAFGSGAHIQFPAGEGWATCHLSGARFAAWVNGGPR